MDKDQTPAKVASPRTDLAEALEQVARRVWHIRHRICGTASYRPYNKEAELRHDVEELRKDTQWFLNKYLEATDLIPPIDPQLQQILDEEEQIEADLAAGYQAAEDSFEMDAEGHLEGCDKDHHPDAVCNPEADATDSN